MEFTSRTGQICTPQHFLVELVCIRKSIKLRIPMEEGKWWNSPDWKKEYGRQISLAHGLIKLFPIESIISALNSKEGSWIYSLSFKGLVDIIKTFENKVKQQEKIDEILDKKDITFEEKAIQEVSQLRFKKKTSLDKLKDLE